MVPSRTATRYFELPELPRREVPTVEGLPPIPPSNDGWEEFFMEVLRHRLTVRQQTEENWSGIANARQREVDLIANNGLYWLNTYGSIYEARPPEDDDEDHPGWVNPFVTYPFQIYVWDWMEQLWRTKGSRGDGALIKSRDMGMSNLACANTDWRWMTKKPWQTRLLSRNEDLVDLSGDPDSLFWKIDLLLKSTPKWVLQGFMPGFDWRYHRRTGRIVNPASLNVIKGESTTASAGRGGRASSIILDEAAFMPRFRAIWTATRASTRHRLIITTVSVEQGTALHDIVEQGEEDSLSVLKIPYFLHPYHDDEWLENERKRDTEAGIRQEIYMDWFADKSEFVYPEAQAKQVGDHPFLPYQGPLFVVYDDGFDDYWAIHWIQYITKTGRHRVIESYRNQHLVADFYGGLMRGQMLDGYHYGEREQEVIEFVNMLPPATYIGDTHGAHVEQVSGMSVIERLSSRWGIYTNVDYEKRKHKDRRQMLGRIIPMMDFNDTDGVRLALHSLKMYRFKKVREGSDTTSEYREPAHDANSHDATAFEFYATNFDQYKNVLTGGGFVYYAE